MSTVYHRIAVASCLLSLATLLFLALSIPGLLMRTQSERYGAGAKSEQFKVGNH